MLLPLVALFVVVPILELYVLLQVGQEIGALPTVALLVADSILGGVLLRSQGSAAWRRLTGALNSGRMPGSEVIDGALIVFGGALLLTPGFLTDGLGVALLVPPTRALVRRMLVRRFAGRIVAGVAAGARRRSGPGVHDVDGSATEVPGRGPELP